jgi:hypothetical protein
VAILFALWNAGEWQPWDHMYRVSSSALLVLATVPVLDLAGNIGLRGNGLTPSKIDDFLSEPSL